MMQKIAIYAPSHNSVRLYLRNQDVSTIGKKLVKQQYLLHMSSQYDELRPTSGWDRFGCFGHPSEFQRVLRLGFVTAATSLTGRQPHFAALNRGRHLYSAGRSSRWALAHILVTASVPISYWQWLLFYNGTCYYDPCFSWRPSIHCIATRRGAKYCSIHVFGSVCPLNIFQKLYIQTSLNFLNMLPVAVARSSTNNSAICYVLSVLWITSSFHIIGQTHRSRPLVNYSLWLTRLCRGGGSQSLIFLNCFVMTVYC